MKNPLIDTQEVEKLYATYENRNSLSIKELDDLLSLQIQYLQKMYLGSIDIPFSESDAEDLLLGYVFNWNFEDINFVLFNSEYYISGTDNDRIKEIENITRFAVETGAYEYIDKPLTKNELLTIVEEYGKVILYKEKTNCIYIDFTEEDLYELRDGGSFEWRFNGYDINIYNDDGEYDDEDEDDEDNE